MRTKNTLFFLACLAVCSAAYCQSSEHLVFKGVPIDVTLNQYVLRMEQEGFNNAGTENGTAVLHGEFAGYKDCIVGVSTLRQKDLVYKIAVVFPEKETWSTLSANYFDLKKMLVKNTAILQKLMKNLILLCPRATIIPGCSKLNLTTVNISLSGKPIKDKYTYASSMKA